MKCNNKSVIGGPLACLGNVSYDFTCCDTFLCLGINQNFNEWTCHAIYFVPLVWDFSEYIVRIMFEFEQYF